LSRRKPGLPLLSRLPQALAAAPLEPVEALVLPEVDGVAAVEVLAVAVARVAVRPQRPVVPVNKR